MKLKKATSSTLIEVEWHLAMIQPNKVWESNQAQLLLICTCHHSLFSMQGKNIIHSKKGETKKRLDGKAISNKI